MINNSSHTGDSMEIGYKRKKQKISEELNSTTITATTSGSAFCTDLSCGESVHATLSKILKYKQPESKSIQFKPSALIAKSSVVRGAQRRQPIIKMINYLKLNLLSPLLW